DVEQGAEEIEDMGGREVRAAKRRLRVVLVDLLKWKLQHKERTRSWHTTLVTQRSEIDDVLRDSPSLRPRLLHDLPRNYARAVTRTAVETGLRADKFPSRCPFTLEQILDQDFLAA